MTRAPAPSPPVLDIEEGVARLMGNRGVYFKALRRFPVHIDAARAVAAQLAAGDHAGAYRAIHSLHGAAGLLGAGEVKAIAFEVETALAHGRAVQLLLDELEGALQRVQARIDVAMLEDAAAPAAMVTPALAPANAPELIELPELLERLCALLDEGNGRALDLLERYGTVLEQALGTAAWETIMAAARDYDLERALVALRGARPAATR